MEMKKRNMFCKFCGAQIPNDSNFCFKCGKYLLTENDNNISEETYNDEINYDDEITPIKKTVPNNSEEVLAQKTVNSTKSEYESGNSQKKLSETDKKRILLEKANGNFWNEMYCGNIYDVNVDAYNETSNGIEIYSAVDNSSRLILSGHEVDSFHICDLEEIIVFRERIKNKRNESYFLYKCDLNGENIELIVGGNDSADYFTVTDEWIFIVVENKKKDQFIYQVSTDLKNASVIKKNVDIRRKIAADDEYLYYVLFDGGPNKVTLMEYDIEAKTERIILQDIGISAFQLYKGKLVVSTFKNCMAVYGQDRGEQLIVISPRNMVKRPLAKTEGTNIICYLDQVFYIEYKTEHVFTIPIVGGIIRDIYPYASSALNMLPCGMGMMVVNHEEERRVLITFGKDIDYEIPILQN